MHLMNGQKRKKPDTNCHYTTRTPHKIKFKKKKKEVI